MVTEPAALPHLRPERFQAFLFPEGLGIGKGGYSNSRNCSFYEELQHFTTPGERLVAHAGTVSNGTTHSDLNTFARLEKFLRRLDALRRSGVAA